MTSEPEFLDVDDVLDSMRCSSSCLEGAQPCSSFGGQFAHGSLYEMAAAYLFHITSNHPFVDGNKRAGLLSALVFLDLNGVTLIDGSDALYELTMAVAEGRVTKAAVAAELERIARLQ